MTKKLLLMLTILACASALQAAPCVSGSLATYIAGAGCTIDGLFFDNFVYKNPAFGGAVSPDATGVLVTPVVMGGEVGLDFTSNWSASGGQTVDGNISYTATCQNCSITDLGLIMVGSGLGAGSATVAELASNGVVLGTANNPGFSQPTDSKTFAPVGSLNIIKDIGASGGAPGQLGSGHVSDVTNLFSTTGGGPPVPEPSLFLFSLGMVALVPIARKKFGRKAQV